MAPAPVRHGSVDMSRVSGVAVCAYCGWRQVRASSKTRPARRVLRSELGRHLWAVHGVRADTT